MGLYTEFEYDKYIYVPEAYHPSHFHGSKAAVRDKKGKFITRSYSITTLDDKFIEISCGRPVNFPEVVDNAVPEKDSVYQSLTVAGEKMGDFEERKKIDVSNGDDVSLSLSVIDFSCSDEVRPTVEKSRSSPIFLNGDSHPISGGKTYVEAADRAFLDLSFNLSSIQGCVTDNFISSDGFVEVCMDLEDREYCNGETVAKSPEQPLKFRCNQTVSHLNDDNALLERQNFVMLHNLLLERKENPSLPCKSKGDDSQANPKAYFSPLKRILDPFMKSKSQQILPISVTKQRDVATIGSANKRRNGTTRRFLLNDFLNIENKTEAGYQFLEEDCSSAVASSPTDFCGLLKLKSEHGVPFFEFSMKGPEDVLAAKIWRVGNSINWVYTFHSSDIRRSNCKKGAKEIKNEYYLIGQMQVLCHLWSEMGKNETSDYSTVVEFVLYDVEHTRKSLCARESSYCSTNSFKGTSDQSLVDGNRVSNLLNHKLQVGNVSGHDVSDALNNLPWATSVLHQYLQIAAIAVEVPFEEKKSLAGKPRNMFRVDEHFSFSDLSSAHWKNKDVINSINPANVKVVTSSGIHGLPSTKDDVGPSSLLDRWRSGGGCDCGGWDVACPLTVFDCPSDNMAHQSFMENCQPLELFVQGLKEKTPAFGMEVIDEGLYSVKFHAPLSMLQAFAISVAILHSSEISTLVGKERDRPRFQCDSPKLLLEEEVKFLVDAVGKEKKKVGKRMEEVTQSFLLNPPFSPIDRL